MRQFKAGFEQQWLSRALSDPALATRVLSLLRELVDQYVKTARMHVLERFRPLGLSGSPHVASPHVARRTSRRRSCASSGLGPHGA